MFAVGTFRFCPFRPLAAPHGNGSGGWFAVISRIARPRCADALKAVVHCLMRRGKQGERGAPNSAPPLVAQRGAGVYPPPREFAARRSPRTCRFDRENMPHIRVPDGIDRKRRELIALLGGAIGWPLFAHAQPASKVWRIGYLGFGTAAAFADRVEALRAGLRDLGYIEGKNIVIEVRWAETVVQLQEEAAELVRVNVDV